MFPVQFLQLKTVLLCIDGEPHIIFVATKTITLGDELLFDYNDRKSKAAFLKSCPICDPHSAGVDIRQRGIEVASADEAPSTSATAASACSAASIKSNE
jgi:hypothetical protein